MTAFLFLAVGVAAGVLSGMFGIGGGIVIVPALLLIAKMSPLTATGTSLAALLLPVGALGAWEYYRNGHVEIKASLLVALGLFAGAWFGARIAHTMGDATIKKAFAVFLVIIAGRIWWTA